MHLGAIDDQPFEQLLLHDVARRQLDVLPAQLALDHRQSRTQLEQGDGLAIDDGNDAIQLDRSWRGRRGGGNEQGRQQDKEMTGHGIDQWSPNTGSAVGWLMTP